MLNRSQRRFAGWLAVAAVTLHFLAPLVSQSLASWRGAPEVLEQICSIHGGNLISASEAPNSPSQDDTNAPLDHCPVCLLHLAHWAPTPQLAPVIVEPLGALPTPQHEALAAEPRLVWESPPSRAPPARS
jgi:hypothetical protein